MVARNFYVILPLKAISFSLAKAALQVYLKSGAEALQLTVKVESRPTLH